MRWSLLLAIVLSTLLSGCSRVQNAPQPLTVLCYNIRIGAGPSGPMNPEKLQESMDAIAAYIQSTDADIVLLQEVDVMTSRSRGMDQASFLAVKTGMQAVFGKAIEVGGGDYGVAILSRHPVRDVEARPLFRPDYSNAVPKPPDWHSEQRVALSLVVDSPGGPVRVINTHLGITEDQRERQLAEIAELIKADTSMPVIFGGDLNAEPKEATLDLIRTHLQDAWQFASNPDSVYTFSAEEPNRTIDYLFFSNHFTVTNIEVPRVMLSDHLPVLANVTLNGSPE